MAPSCFAHNRAENSSFHHWISEIEEVRPYIRGQGFQAGFISPRGGIQGRAQLVPLTSGPAPRKKRLRVETIIVRTLRTPTAFYSLQHASEISPTSGVPEPSKSTSGLLQRCRPKRNLEGALVFRAGESGLIDQMPATHKHTHTHTHTDHASKRTHHRDQPSKPTQGNCTIRAAQAHRPRQQASRQPRTSTQPSKTHRPTLRRQQGSRQPRTSTQPS